MRPTSDFSRRRTADPSKAARQAVHAGDVRALIGLLDPAHTAGFAVFVLRRLATMGPPDLGAPILEYFGLDSRPGPRAAAVEALGKLEYRPAIQRLRVEALSGKPWRHKATEALGMIGGAEAVDALADVVASSEPLLRHTAASALGRIATDEAVAILERLLSDPNWRVRTEAYSALRSIETEVAADAIARQIPHTRGWLRRRGMRRRVEKIRAKGSRAEASDGL